MNDKNVVIDGVEYKPVSADGSLHIVVLDRGFVVVGNVTHDGQYVIIDNCKNIRKWGTTRGLGQIASEGPTDKTVLDPQPRTRVHELQVVQLIECEVSKWNR
jgi:hypothetical protein